MPPLKNLPETFYCQAGDSEFENQWTQFRQGNYNLLRVDETVSDNSVYFFTLAEKNMDHHTILAHAMMESVIDGVVAGEFYGNYETYLANGENPLPSVTKEPLATIPPIVIDIDTKPTKLDRILQKLRKK